MRFRHTLMVLVSLRLPLTLTACDGFGDSPNNGNTSGGSTNGGGGNNGGGGGSNNGSGNSGSVSVTLSASPQNGTVPFEVTLRANASV